MKLSLESKKLKMIILSPIHWSSTGIKQGVSLIVPGGDWTMETKGMNQVTVAGTDYKRQITVLVLRNLAPFYMYHPNWYMQVNLTGVYSLLTCRVPRWLGHDLYQLNWSTEDSMIHYMDKIIVPYVNDIRENLLLGRINQKVIAIFDIFAAHKTDSLL